ncbi:MAG: CPBP family intramembrane metalloprotease [Bacteroidaceae bacterium]|nr:CPBP family intramembrane metalloprotease [Bacteroidaceae bacterium]
MKKYLILILQIGVFLILMGIFMLIGTSLMLLAGVNPTSIGDINSGTFQVVLQEVVLLVSILLAAYIIVRFWEKKPFSDLGFSFIGRGKDICWGFLIAVMIYAIGFAVSLLFGWVKIVDVGFSAKDFFFYLLLMLFVGMAEEAMCRGFLLGRMLNVGMHPLLALLLSSLFFAALHLGNDGITWFAFVNLVLAGILLGTTYLYTRNLAFPIILHCFWNFIQGAVCGYAVSGSSKVNSVFSIALDEHTLMNGGEFGFEGSLVCTILMLVFTVILLRYVGPKLDYSRH